LVKLVVVDLFGTLIPAESDAIAHRELSERLCRVLGCDPRELEEAYWRVVEELGDSSLALARVVEGFCSSKGIENPFTREELEYLHTWSHIEAVARLGELPGASTFLRGVKGLGALVGVVSDAAPGVPQGILRALGLEHFVNEVVASGECGFRKPDPALIRALIARLGVKPSAVVVVGDSWRDVEMARRFGALSVAVGFVEGASYVARNLLEALEMVAELLQG